MSLQRHSSAAACLGASASSQDWRMSVELHRPRSVTVQTGGSTKHIARPSLGSVMVHAFGLGAVIGFFAATLTDAPGPVVFVSGLLTLLYLLLTSEALTDRRTE
jgi:uncharacterized membrane protein YkgB